MVLTSLSHYVEVSIFKSYFYLKCAAYLLPAYLNERQGRKTMYQVNLLEKPLGRLTPSLPGMTNKTGLLTVPDGWVGIVVMRDRSMMLSPDQSMKEQIISASPYPLEQ